MRHVFDSRTAGFADGVLAATNGRGVDVVLNSLSGDLIAPGFAVLAASGCFIEMGKRDIKTAAWVDGLRRGIRYHVVDWGDTARRDPALIAGLYAQLLQRMRQARLPPLPRHVFELQELRRAFRCMAQAQACRQDRDQVSAGCEMRPADGATVPT